ncbi:MAG TPA: glucosamine-6-phosphate deaminase [Candidatus Faecivivens stercorigallinarum]|nr:glucosamine-6-phosphate deaminase [Candidatus Faecivivens stercorigallinarum]
MKLIVAPDYAGICEKAANIFADEIRRNPACVLGLATGSTPVGLYQQLIRRYQDGTLDLSHVQTFNLDEYCGLAGDHPQSYRWFMQKNLFDHVNIPPQQTHIPSGIADDPEEECRRYDALIESCGGIDIQLLGIGHNGHIGFNEPDDHFPVGSHLTRLTDSTIQANSRFFASEDEVPTHAITMGAGSILKAKKILLMASGQGKAEILCRSMTGPVTPAVPASVLQLHRDAVILADEAAASLLCRIIPPSEE